MGDVVSDEERCQRPVEIVRDVHHAFCAFVSVIRFCLDTDLVHRGERALGTAEEPAAYDEQNEQQSQPRNSFLRFGCIRGGKKRLLWDIS